MYGHNFVFLKEIAWMSGCCQFLHPCKMYEAEATVREVVCVCVCVCVWCMCEGWVCGVKEESLGSF